MARWAPDTRERLREAAMQLFAERGFDATTVPDIVARVFPTRYHRVVEWIETAARVLPARRTIDAAADASRSVAVR